MKKYLSVAEVCARLPVGKSLVYRLVNDGTLASTRFGGKILVLEDALETLLEGGRPPEPELRSARAAPTPRRPRKPKGKRVELW